MYLTNVYFWQILYILKYIYSLIICSHRFVLLNFFDILTEKQDKMVINERLICSDVTHLESLLAVLQVQAVWTVPVAVNDVCLSVTVKVCQRHTSPVLISVFNSCHHTITHKSEGG